MRKRRHGQRGFSLIIVFLLMILMVGVAAAVLVATQGDLQVSAHDRESQAAFYNAEAGIAFAKDWVLSQGGAQGGTWNAILNNVDATKICPPINGAVGTKPAVTAPYIPFATVTGGSYQFCVHNNALDVDYTLTPPVWSATKDSDGILTIEAYGYGPAGSGAVTHVSVEVQTTTALLAGDNSPLMQRSGDAVPVDPTQKATF